MCIHLLYITKKGIPYSHKHDLINIVNSKIHVYVSFYTVLDVSVYTGPWYELSNNLYYVIISPPRTGRGTYC